MLEDTVVRLLLDNKKFAYAMIVTQQHHVKDEDRETLFQVAAIGLV